MTDTLSAASYLRKEFIEKLSLINSQQAVIQPFFEARACQIADVLLEHRPKVKFTLPDQIFTETSQNNQPVIITVPARLREQSIGGFFCQLAR